MSIAPIIRTVQVTAEPARAFELFATRMGDWWPKGGTVGKKHHVAVVIEPRDGGRWYERDEDGVEAQWGKVLAWEPPGRLLLGWQLDSNFAYDPDFVTEVELTFASTEGGGTRVTLEHRNLERFGANAESHAEKLRNGWPTRVDAFAKFANAK
jgi:Activator of Hsp90 ATPase homolog 1-like protein